MSTWLSSRLRVRGVMLGLALLLAACGSDAGTGESPSARATSRPIATAETNADPPTVPADGPAPTRKPRPTSAPAPAAFDACALLTAEEAEAVLGEPVSAPKPEEPILKPGGASAQACRYRVNPFNDLSLVVYRFGDAESAETQYGLLGDLGEDSEQVAGLGDRASGEEDAQTRLGMLNILSGPYYIEISTLADADDRLEKLKAAAALVLERLP